MKHFVRIPAPISETLKDLYVPLIIVFILFVISLLLFFADFFKGDWDTILFGNLATTLFGVIVVVLLLDSYIRHRDKKLSEHRRQVALRSLSLALRRHLGTIFNMFKATSVEAPDNPQRQVKPKVFFNETFYNTIVYLDFVAQAPILPAMSWGQYLFLQFKDFTDRLENAVDKFGAVLFPGDLDLVEQLINSRYAGSLTTMLPSSLFGGPAAMLLSVEDGGSITYTSIKVKECSDRAMRAYHDALTELISLVNESLLETDQDPIMVVQHWEQTQAPAVGSARVNVVRPN